MIWAEPFSRDHPTGTAKDVQAALNNSVGYVVFEKRYPATKFAQQ